MREIQLLFIQAGWVAIPLVGFSILSLGLFIFIHFKIKGTYGFWKEKPPSGSENEWEELSHSLVVAASWIASIAGLSTLVGLFGTVLGIQASFRNMQESGQVSLEVFAGGVSLALSTTILGLGVAIPSYILYQIAKTKIAGLEKKFFSKNIE